MAKLTELVNHVKQYARDHYDQDGWDVIVECWGDNEIADEINLCLTNEEAVSQMHQICKAYDSRRRDVQAEVF